ncbi:MAG: hypothetical protein CVT92_03485 [Bacteroidetes bacterium HGW-Bacteroidetes-1]|jgi:hypothetical protein|nr:MAG: hypothetical protein CVT92_03485 [Bacteroidetes bacterium HGW-Bacteroidetes-1]
MKKRVLVLGLFVLISLVTFTQNVYQGTVLYHQNPEYPIEGVQVSLFGSDNQLVATVETDEFGGYFFDGLSDGTYTVRATTTLPGAQIAIQQAVYILMYINGLYQFDPIQFLAADVNGSGSVNFSDFMFIVVNYFVFHQPFPAGTWIFEEIEFSTGSRDGNSLGGSRIGDVEGVFVPTGRDIINEFIITERESVSPAVNDEFIVPVYANTYSDLVGGYGLVLGFDPQMIEVIEVIPFGDNAAWGILNNQIRISCFSTQLGPLEAFDGKIAEVRVKLLQPATESFFPFNVKGESQVLNSNGLIENDVEYAMPKLLANVSQNVNIATLYPNPASFNAVLSVTSGAAIYADLMLFNQIGQLVMTHTVQLSEGANEFDIPVEELQMGVYQVILRDKATRDMILSQKLIKQ